MRSSVWKRRGTRGARKRGRAGLMGDRRSRLWTAEGGGGGTNRWRGEDEGNWRQTVRLCAAGTSNARILGGLRKMLVEEGCGLDSRSRREIVYGRSRVGGFKARVAGGSSAGRDKYSGVSEDPVRHHRKHRASGSVNMQQSPVQQPHGSRSRPCSAATGCLSVAACGPYDGAIASAFGAVLCGAVRCCAVLCGAHPPRIATTQIPAVGARSPTRHALRGSLALHPFTRRTTA
ncbi:hypothetical protein FB567DRAFT_263541 [Paraphoma chrysanthemicola]|uniref:Uncharacterized protein n=1 Tax=Paraphoma chrysanthemicola TaxID=798071 RepID=A0A8K0REG5_9PLEO|nr:hypothetical protein FB567DRAFT_263541 [Paraphoma chrysanthemicola]